MKNKKPDVHGNRMRFIIQRINEINEWRNERMKQAVSLAEAEMIDAKVLQWREAVEKAS